jgi:hypothetical protein
MNAIGYLDDDQNTEAPEMTSLEAINRQQSAAANLHDHKTKVPAKTTLKTINRHQSATAELTFDAVDRMSPDTDRDGLNNLRDNCPLNRNPDQSDTDKDAVGDKCDNCIAVFNPGQEDINHNSIGDTCETN